MDKFLKHAKTESRRLRAEHAEIVAAAYATLTPAAAIAAELQSASARLWLADELEVAARLVRQAVRNSQKLETLFLTS